MDKQNSEMSIPTNMFLWYVVYDMLLVSFIFHHKILCHIKTKNYLYPPIVQQISPPPFPVYPKFPVSLLHFGQSVVAWKAIWPRVFGRDA